jgi:hypothetical protein
VVILVGLATLGRSPRRRPKATDYRISDQGMMNIALRSTEPSRIQNVIDRAVADPLVANHGYLGQWPDRDLYPGSRS